MGERGGGGGERGGWGREGKGGRIEVEQVREVGRGRKGGRRGGRQIEG